MSTDKEFVASQISLSSGSSWSSFLFVALVVLATRLPFLSAGYGSDPDCWDVVRAARRIATEGHYVVSRFPGYPLQELACAGVWRSGPFMLNGLTALMSVAATLFFMALLRQWGCSMTDAVLGALAFSMTPVIFVTSTTTIDYLWALAFILAGYYALQMQRSSLAGICLGLAIGCRLTSLLMLAVYLLSIYIHSLTKNSVDDDRPSVPTRFLATQLIRCALAALVVAFIIYIPVLKQYGLGFLTYYAPPKYPAWSAILSRVTLRLWGLIGTLGIVIALSVHFLRRPYPKPQRAISDPLRRRLIFISVIVISMFVVVFLRLPLEEGYLIPAIPFVLFLLACFLSRRSFRYVCIALCLSPWLGTLGRASPGPWAVYSSTAWHVPIGGEVILDFFNGPILRDHAQRIREMEYVDRLIAQTDALPTGSVVIVGDWKPRLRWRFFETPEKLTPYLYLLSPRHLARCKAEHRKIYYLPEIRQFNLDSFNIDVAEFGSPLIVTLSGHEIDTSTTTGVTTQQSPDR